MPLSDAQHKTLQEAITKSKQTLTQDAPNLAQAFKETEEALPKWVPPAPPAPTPAPTATLVGAESSGVVPTASTHDSASTLGSAATSDVVKRSWVQREGRQKNSAKLAALRQHALKNDEAYRQERDERGTLQKVGQGVWETFADPVDTQRLDKYREQLVDKFIQNPSDPMFSDPTAIAILQIDGQQRHGRKYRSIGELREHFATEEQKTEARAQVAASGAAQLRKDGQILVQVDGEAFYMPAPHNPTEEERAQMQTIAPNLSGTQEGAALAVNVDEDTADLIESGVALSTDIRTRYKVLPPSDKPSVYSWSDGPQPAKLAMRRFVTRFPDGSYGIDKEAYLNSISAGLMERYRKEEGVTAMELFRVPDEKVAEWRKRAYTEASRRVDKILLGGKGALLIDRNPTETAVKIASGETGLAPFLTAPGRLQSAALKAAGLQHLDSFNRKWGDRDISVQRMIERGVAPLSAMLRPGDDESVLEWVGRAGIFNVILPPIIDEEVRAAGVGSPQHVLAERTGWDWWSDDERYAQIVNSMNPAGQVEWAASKVGDVLGTDALDIDLQGKMHHRARKLMHAATGLFLLVIEPDLFLLAGGPIGKVGEAGLKLSGLAASKAKKVAAVKAAGYAADIANKLEAGEISERAAINMMREQTGPGIAQMAGVAHGREMGAVPFADTAATETRKALEAARIDAMAKGDAQAKVHTDRIAEIASELTDKAKQSDEAIALLEAELKDVTGQAHAIVPDEIPKLLEDLQNYQSPLVQQIAKHATDAQGAFSPKKTLEYAEAHQKETVEQLIRHRVTTQEFVKDADIPYRVDNVVTLVSTGLKKEYRILRVVAKKGKKSRYHLVDLKTGNVRTQSVGAEALRPTEQMLEDTAAHLKLLEDTAAHLKLLEQQATHISEDGLQLHIIKKNPEATNLVRRMVEEGRMKLHVAKKEQINTLVPLIQEIYKTYKTKRARVSHITALLKKHPAIHKSPIDGKKTVGIAYSNKKPLRSSEKKVEQQIEAMDYTTPHIAELDRATLIWRMQREGSWVNAVADATKFQKKAASAFSKVEREAMQRAAKRDKKLAEITGKIDEAQEQSAAAAKALDEGNLEDFPGIPKKLLSKLEKARAGVAKVEEGVQESLTYLAKKEANTDALVRALRRTGDELAKYAKALDSAAPDAMDGDRALKALDAIYTTSGSALRGLSPANPLTWALTAQVATRRLINVFDPIKTRVKEFAKPIRDAQVVAERHGNQLQDELRGLSTLKGAPGLIFEWLTSSRAITIGGVRTTAENRLSENTLWDDAVSHMIEEVIDVETGLAIPQVKSGGKRALQALSRVWLPPGHTATKDALDTLERHTAAWLKEGVSLEDLIHGRDHLRSLSNDIVQTTLSDMASTEEAVMGAAAAVLAGANTERMMERIARIVGPPVDSDTAWSITRILSGFGAEDYEKTKALAFKADEALDVMAEWGISLLPTKDRSVFQRLFNLQPKVSRMVAYGQLASLQGRPMYVPDAFLKNIDEYNKTFFKLVEDSSDVGLTQKAFRPYKTFMSTWQRAAVQGVVLPNAGRPALTIFTDAFSLLQEEGLHKAPQIAALMSETALGYIPYVGAKMQSALAQMAAKADGKTVLGSLLNAVFDPVVDMLMRGKRSTATLKTGSGTLSLDAVMKGAIERGVMSKQFAGVPEEYFQRTALQGGMWKKMRETGTKLNSLVRETTSAFEEAQIRQRLSLYVKKLKEGATEDEAAQAVLNSFYDWDHGVAKWEMQALANIFVFPTMWRLIFNQQFRAMSEALSVPKSMGKAGKLQQLTDAAVHLSNSRLARARKLITLQQGIPETLAEHPSDTDMLDDLEATQAYYQAARPWYHDAQTALTNSQIAPERSKWWKETTGKTVTYEAWTMPETTQSETWQSIGTVMALASGASFFADEGTEFSQDAFDSFLEDVLMDRMTPAVKEFSSGAAEKLGYEARPESKRLRAAERVMLRPLDNSMKEMGMNFLNSDQTALMSEAGPAMLSGLRMIPGASTGTTWVNAVKANNPNFDLGEYQAGIAHMLAHLAGRVRVTGFDPVSDDVYATKKAKGQLSRLRNAVDKEAKQTPLRERDPGESER